MITNQISQVIAVRRAMPGPHRWRSAEIRPSLGAAAATSGVSGVDGTGGSGARVAAATRRSRSVTTTSASAWRPLAMRKRGDSGSERRHHSSITTGSAVITCATRQPSPMVGTTNRPIRAAATNPKEKNPDSAPTNQPRRAAGTNSDRNGAMMALSAPVPRPASTRAPRNTS